MTLTNTGAAGSALVAITTALVGQNYSPLVIVLFAASVGAIISLGEVQTAGKLAALWYCTKYVAMAVALASGLSYFIGHYTGLPAVELLAIVAFLIGWVGNRWGAVLTAVLNGALAFFNKKGNGP
ncbi:hypothetical protein [Polaromonas sp.]|uniref:hypothetical protein n=1 Tax=Polaromonas sp. TaxID=1869339 RepID=UPI003264E9E2